MLGRCGASGYHCDDFADWRGAASPSTDLMHEPLRMTVSDDDDDGDCILVFSSDLCGARHGTASIDYFNFSMRHTGTELQFH